MSTPDRTDVSLRGLGAGLMLPAQGNPFAKAPPPPEVEVLAVGAERAASEQAVPEAARPLPNSLSPTPAAGLAPATTVPTEVSMPEPRDLTPEDLMALFPSTHAERDILPADTAVGALAAPPAAEPQPAATVLADMVTTTALDTAPAPAAPVSATLLVPVPSTEVVPVAAPAVPAVIPSVEVIPAAAPAAPPAPAAQPVAEVVLLPPGEAAPAAAPLVPGAPPPAAPARPPAPVSPVESQRGMRLMNAAVPAAGAAIALSLAKDELQAGTFTPSASLPASAKLTALFVPDARLMTLWLEIDSVEADVAATEGMSQNLAGELLDRLMQARNLLMNKRSQYEEAARQVAEVKHHLANFRGTNFLHQPPFISLYLLAFLALVAAGFALGQSLAWDRLMILNTKLDMLWYTLLMGGIGGFTGAVYSLVQHVARDRDYDPQFALWYYQNPWMGLVLGIFVYIAVYIVMNMGSLVVTQQTTNGSLISSFITLFFGWIVGFKHNIAFDLADMALKKLLPSDSDSDSSGSGNAKPPAPAAGQ